MSKPPKEPRELKTRAGFKTMDVIPKDAQPPRYEKLPELGYDKLTEPQKCLVDEMISKGWMSSESKLFINAHGFEKLEKDAIKANSAFKAIGKPPSSKCVP